MLHNCPECLRDFNHPYSKKKYCSRKCYLSKKSPENKMVRPYTKQVKEKAILARDAVLDRIIDYPDSPNGKAYVGINKEPFMPVKNGYGFQGVLLQDADRKFIQCFSCGKWAKIITSNHIKKCSNMEVKDYKKKYGLNASTGLVSDETSLKYTESALKNKTFRTNPKVIERRNIPPKNYKNRQRMEWYNRHGTCPEQLKTRTYEFILQNRELPSQHNRGRPIYKALTRRYKSFGAALSALGLPEMQRKGTNMKFTFPDYTVYSYNINKLYQREALYAAIMEKCPAIREYKKIPLKDHYKITASNSRHSQLPGRTVMA